MNYNIKWGKSLLKKTVRRLVPVIKKLSKKQVKSAYDRYNKALNNVNIRSTEDEN